MTPCQLPRIRIPTLTGTGLGDGRRGRGQLPVLVPAIGSPLRFNSTGLVINRPVGSEAPDKKRLGQRKETPSLRLPSSPRSPSRVVGDAALGATIVAAMSPTQLAMTTPGRVCARCARIVRIESPFTMVWR